MPVCVAAHSSGGQLFLTLDPARTDLSTCAYLIEDGASNAWRELGNMSTENAIQIGMAVGLVWAGAWGIKQLVRTIRIDVDASPN